MLLNQYKNIALLPFIEKMEQECYDIINGLCLTAKKQAAKLNELEVRQSTSQYVSLCTKLIEEIENYIKYRKEILLPYIHTLSEKDATGHNCSNCTGSACKIQHNGQLIELEGSHHQIKDTLYRLQMAVLPLYSETIYPDAYRILRNQMALLENRLTEMLFFESTYLAPKIVEAQKNINARS
jgi:hypothetical protein